MKFTPRPHQEKIVSWLLENKRSAIFSFMGSGKTGACLAALQALDLIEPVFPVLIIAPLRVAKSTWPNELAKWEMTLGLKVGVIAGCGTLHRRHKVLDAPADVYTINYEQLPWLVEDLKHNWPFKTVIADECTKLKGFRTRQGSTRAKAFAKVAHTLVDRMIMLTGTPAPNGLLDLWGQLWFIDKGERLGTSFSKFCQKWFYLDYSGFNWLPKDNAQKEIQDAIKDVCLTIKAEDWFDLGTPIVNTISVKMPETVRKQYKSMERHMFAELASGDIAATSAGSKTMKCRQMAAGAVYIEGSRDWEEVHNEKISALETIIEESNGAAIMVAYHFEHDLARLRQAFPKGVLLDQDPRTESAWNGGEIPLLFLHPSSAGMGLNLQDGGNILVFFSLDWRMEDHVQVIERIGPMRQKQSGHNRPVFLHYLLMEDSIDEIMFERIATKKSVQEVLLDAMNRFKKLDV